MKDKKQFSLEVGGKTLTLEVSSLAEQANSAVLAKYGETVVLVTTVMSHRDTPMDYLPLRVEYEERFYAAGKILGSRYMRREGRPSEDAVLSGRLIDRTIRPLFDHRMRREIQVVMTVLAIDEENEPEFVSLMGASTALSISSIPWAGPVAAVRVAKIGEKLVVNPTVSELAGGYVFESFVAGPKDRINMVELAGNEAPEAEVLSGFMLAQKEINRLIEFQEKIVKEIGKPKAEVAIVEIDTQLRHETEEFLATRLEDALYQPDKLEQVQKMNELRRNLEEHLALKFAETDVTVDPKHVEHVWEEFVDRTVHENILKSEKRPDGRPLTQVRQLSGEVGLFKRTHGSALFVRGNTQALAITTLAPPGAEQLIETMETSGKRRFMLHYNFPPYSVGEVGFFRGPGRREIGHGALAKKAIEPLLPSQEEFPYIIRIVSEIMSSNGSSSMATACASLLSMMDAGVPIKKLAAGIAMGIILGDKGAFKVLTDIQGPEDHYGDMDFKVAGTEDGVTAVQLDVKVEGLTMEMIEKTLTQAKQARLDIMAVMKTILPAARTEISPLVPVIVKLQINPEKIGMVIGGGGKTINGLIKRYELTTIDIEEDGSVYIAAPVKENALRAQEEIRGITREFTIGEVVEGTVMKIMDFGAIIDLGGGQDGMVHVSELRNEFTKSVTDVLKLGDFVRAKIIKLEEGRIGLSIKALSQQ